MVERDVVTCSILELGESRNFALDLPDILVIRMVEVDDLQEARQASGMADQTSRTSSPTFNAMTWPVCVFVPL
jgi:hypothetical protein